jgi:hypothetical protein
LLKIFNKDHRPKQLFLPPKHDEMIVDDGPYRTHLQVDAEISLSDANDVMAIVSNDSSHCPLCSTYTGTDDIEFCTPFHRVILKRRLFKQNVKCRLRGAHFHCHCTEHDCNTQWIVNSDDPKWISINDRLDRIDNNVERAQKLLEERQEKVFENIEFNGKKATRK